MSCIFYLKTLWGTLRKNPCIKGRDDIQYGESKSDWERDMIQ